MQSDGKFLVGTLEEIMNGLGQVYCHSDKAREYCENVLKTDQNAILGVFRYEQDNRKSLVEIVAQDARGEYEREIDRLQARIDELEAEAV